MQCDKAVDKYKYECKYKYYEEPSFFVLKKSSDNTVNDVLDSCSLYVVPGELNSNQKQFISLDLFFQIPTDFHRSTYLLT